MFETVAEPKGEGKDKRGVSSCADPAQAPHCSVALPDVTSNAGAPGTMMIAAIEGTAYSAVHAARLSDTSGNVLPSVAPPSPIKASKPMIPALVMSGANRPTEPTSSRRTPIIVLLIVT